MRDIAPGRSADPPSDSRRAAILAGSPNNYDAEFMADLDQARRHLDAAQDIINETRTTT